jgi:hypothetical protein
MLATELFGAGTSIYSIDVHHTLEPLFQYWYQGLI